MQEILVLILSYFIGAIPFSYIFTHLITGIDIREKGSGNVGSTNVLRTAGLKVALASFAGDVLKGVLAAWLGLHFGGYILAGACSIGAVAGHCWPVFLNFRGGKGVATSAGIVFYLFPHSIPILVLIFIIIVALSRYVSLGSISVAMILPFMFWLYHKPSALLLMSVVIALLVIFQHRENIKRIRSGSESKIGKKS